MRRILFSSLFISLFLCLFGASFIFGFLASESSKNYELSEEKPITHVNSEKLMVNVNNWRLSQNLQPFSHSIWLCDQAILRAYDIQTDNSHNGFMSRYKDKYDIAENLSEGYSEDEAVKAWLESATHAQNLKSSYKYSCIRCINNRCAQLFANQ